MYGVRLNGFETAFKKRFSFRYRYLAGLIGDGQHIAKALAFANCGVFPSSSCSSLFSITFTDCQTAKYPPMNKPNSAAWLLPIPCRIRQEAK